MKWASNPLKLLRAKQLAQRENNETEEHIKELYIKFGGKVLPVNETKDDSITPLVVEKKKGRPRKQSLNS